MSRKWYKTLGNNLLYVEEQAAKGASIQILGKIRLRPPFYFPEFEGQRLRTETSEALAKKSVEQAAKGIPTPIEAENTDKITPPEAA